jgi:hypothetical protein
VIVVYSITSRSAKMTAHGFDEQIFGANEQMFERGQIYLSGIGLKVMCEKQRTSTFSHRRRVKRPSLICSAN